MTLDTLLYNGEFHSMDDTNSIYEAMGIKDGRISFLGKDEEARGMKVKEKNRYERETNSSRLCRYTSSCFRLCRNKKIYKTEWVKISG